MKRRIIGSSQPVHSQVAAHLEHLVAVNPDLVGHKVYFHQVPSDVDITPVTEFIRSFYRRASDLLCSSSQEIASVFNHHGYDVKPEELSIEHPRVELYDAENLMTFGRIEIESGNEYVFKTPNYFPTIYIQPSAILRNIDAPEHIIKKLASEDLLTDSFIGGTWGVDSPEFDLTSSVSEYANKVLKEYLEDGRSYKHHLDDVFLNAQYLANKLLKISEGKYTTNVGDRKLSVKRFFNRSNMPATTGDFYSDYLNCVNAVISTVIPEIYPQCSASLENFEEGEVDFEHTLKLKFTDCIIRYALPSDRIEEEYQSGGSKAIISYLLKLLRSEKYARRSTIKYPKN